MGLIQEHPQTMTGERKTAAIVGYGDEGVSIYNYLSGQGQYDITIIDDTEQPKHPIPSGAKTRLGPGSVDEEMDYDVVWRASPPIAPSRLRVQQGEVRTIAREFFDKCQVPIIGVTGSKGKGTTASLIHKILVKSGLTSHLVGNIGHPALDVLSSVNPDDIVVYELSSFQLWDLEKSPQTAVVLMVEPEHLDVHADVDDYVRAKQNITRWQMMEDLVVHHPTNELSLKVAKVGLGEKQAFLTTQGGYIKDDQLMIAEQNICSINDFGLIGTHNHENIAAAVTAAWRYSQNTDAMASSLREFKGLEHRLQVISAKDGVTYVDDSIATTPGSTIAAINSFNQPEILILGGSDKGADFSELARHVVESGVKHALLIGATADKLADVLESAGFKGYERIDAGMKKVVNRAHELAGDGDVVILSPACASFDMFKSYADRAQQFKTAVEEL